jgi:hypothetical protein
MSPGNGRLWPALACRAVQEENYGALGNELDGRGCIPDRGRYFSFPHEYIPIFTVTHLAFRQMGIGG